MSDAVKDQIMERLSSMSEEEQRRMLEIARSIAPNSGNGVSGSSLLRFAGAINPEDARRMSDAIEEDCERTRSASWRVH